MKAVAVTIAGLEDITRMELSEIIGADSEVALPSRVLFSVEDENDLAEFVYRARSIIKSYLLVAKFKFVDRNDVVEKISNIKISYLKDSFVVRCERVGLHDFNSLEVEKAIGELIKRDYKIRADLDNPKTIVFIDIIDNDCFVGIDFSGIRISRRYYRIKLLSSSINPVVAYSMLRYSGINENDFILDVFCRSGEIPIEAALFLNNIPNCYYVKDKLQFTKFIDIKFDDNIENKKLNIVSMDCSQNSVRASEINAKIAFVNKFIRFTRLELDWLDTKFDKETVTKIITFPPYPSNSFPVKLAEKFYNELFNQAKYILKKNGLITLLTPKKDMIEKYALMYKFTKVKEIELVMGKNKFNILVFQKD